MASTMLSLIACCSLRATERHGRRRPEGRCLHDPVGELIERFTLENGLDVQKRRIPLGVIASIYESRPNVTTDIVSLALKSGNACLLRAAAKRP